MRMITTLPRAITAALWLLAVYSVSAFAEPVKIMNLDECISTALAQHPKVIASQGRYDESQGRLGMARGAKLPQMDFRTDAQRYDWLPVNKVNLLGGGSSNVLSSLNLSQLLFSSGKAEAEIDSARSSLAASSQDVRRTRQEVAFGVASSYYGLLKAQAILNARSEAVGQMEQHLKVAQEKLDIGKAAKLDVFRAEVQLADVTQSRLAAANQVEIAKLQLLNSMGVDSPDQDIAVADDISPTENVYDKDALLAEALSRHPDRMRNEMLVRSAEYKVKAAKADSLPNLSLVGSYKVDEHLQTSDPDIYAGGDCVENINRLTGKPCYVPLGSTANKHGRVIGDNVTGGDSVFPGVLGTVIFKAFDFSVGRVGLSEKDCSKLGIPHLVAITPGSDRAHYYPTAKPIVMKLISQADSDKLLGVQAVGMGDVAKRIDVVATALSYGATTRDLADIDLAYAPPYSSAVDLLAHASNVIDNKKKGVAAAISPVELKKKLDSGERLLLLDVRSPQEVEAAPFVDPRVVNIPLGKLRTRLAELPKDKEIGNYSARLHYILCEIIVASENICGIVDTIQL